MEITGYHAHLYYRGHNLEEARTLSQKIHKKFGLPIGKLHEKPVGPHPEWSCAVSVPPDRFHELIPWLALNRGSIDFLIHPMTGHDLLDHTEHVMWLGKSYSLNLEGW